MNRALEELAARVSPAVVQHAVRSGVIVDSNGYIMTNAQGDYTHHRSMSNIAIFHQLPAASLGTRPERQDKRFGRHRMQGNVNNPAAGHSQLKMLLSTSKVMCRAPRAFIDR